jgi:probable phosphoglycerate mutase
MPPVSAYSENDPYVTKDGSLVRELMHPARHDSRAQSLAEAEVPVGGETTLHLHRTSEELYHITRGKGIMTLGAETFEVHPGDTVCIPPGTPHRIRNAGTEPLRILCACAPPYSHDDTELIAWGQRPSILKTTLILIRHGETAWNAQDRIQGHEDIPLSERGTVQAKALAARFARDSVHALYSSDLARALETARHIGEVTGHPLVSDPRLRERHLGVLQGVVRGVGLDAVAEVYARYRESDPDYLIPGGESTRQFAARVLSCIEELVKRHRGETVVVVSHGGVLDQVYRRALGMPIAGPRAFTVRNTSVNRLHVEGESWSLGAWGDVCHLDDPDAPPRDAG